MKDNKGLIIGGIVVVVVVAAVIYYLTKAADEEAPIIVKNGSMYIDIDPTATWGEAGDWVHQPASGTHSGELYVKVVLKTGTPPSCLGSGHPVRVDYNPGFNATFNVVPGGSSYRTIVAPRAQLQRDPNIPTRLRHGVDGQGRIESVVIPGSTMNCVIPDGQLIEVRICSSNTETDPNRSCT